MVLWGQGRIDEFVKNIKKEFDDNSKVVISGTYLLLIKAGWVEGTEIEIVSLLNGLDDVHLESVVVISLLFWKKQQHKLVKKTCRQNSCV